MKDVWRWLAGLLGVVVLSLVSYVWLSLAAQVNQLSETVSSLDATLNETNLLLRANGIAWPQPARRQDDE